MFWQFYFLLLFLLEVTVHCFDFTNSALQWSNRLVRGTYMILQVQENEYYSIKEAKITYVCMQIYLIIDRVKYSS